VPIPKTSITLLKDLASNAGSARWSEFVARYEGPMRGFLRQRYPTVEADDVIQNALVALMKALPNYNCTSDERGYFRDYLMGVVRHKAVDAIKSRAAESEKRMRFAKERDCHRSSAEEEDGAWRTALMNAAIEQLMSDGSIAPRTREIFRHVALMHEAPESVAAQFGTTRGNVDVIKKRMIDRLSELVRNMSDDV
jgi:RNA polymerase sigma factor (sigma-70 family)